MTRSTYLCCCTGINEMARPTIHKDRLVQLNVGISKEQFQKLRIAATRKKMAVAAYVREWLDSLEEK